MEQVRIKAREDGDPSLEERRAELERKRKAKRKRRGILRMLALLLILGFCASRSFTADAIREEGMAPALVEGDLVLFQCALESYYTGDIALVEFGGTRYVRRIVALPGQTVDIREETGELYIDGELLQESYVYEGTYGKDEISFPLTLEEGEYFLLGDHRENARDSRNYGPVTEKQLKGKLLCTLMRWW